MIAAVERMRVLGPFEVEVRSGPPGVTAYGARDALLGVNVRAEGTALTISAGTTGFERRVRGAAEPIRIIVSTPALRAVSSNGGAKIRVARLRGGKVDLALEGTGSIDVGEIRADELGVMNVGLGAITVAGSAVKARVRGATAGSIDAGKLLANDAVLLWESRGTLNIGVRYTVQVSNSGQGAVNITGKPECRTRGAGPISCGPAKPR